MKNYLMKKIKEVLPKIKVDDTYVISFYLGCNEAYETIPQFAIGSNGENECNKDPLSEDRWNYAYWIQNEIDVISDMDPSSIKKLKDWYNEVGIVNPGYVDRSVKITYENYKDQFCSKETY